MDIPEHQYVLRIVCVPFFVFVRHGIQIVGHRHKADIMLRKKLFGQSADFDVVSAQTGKILHKHGGGLAHAELFDHFVEFRPVHRYPGNTVITEYDNIGIALVLGNLRQQFLLVADAVALTLQFVVTR